MEVSYATMIAMGTLVQRLGRDAQRYQAALAEAVNESAEWKRIADELKAERDAERKAHDEYKERNREIFNGNQRLTAELAVIKDERDALRAECDRLAKSFDKQRERIRELVNQNQRLTAELAANSAEIERLKKPARQHPVKAGEWVWVHEHRRANQVQEVHADWYWLSTCDSCRFDRCTPFDPPEATHDTPAGKDAAESAVKREPKPGDTVRLVRIPTPGPDFDGFIDFPWNTDWGVVGDVATVVATLAPPNLPVVAVRVSSGIVVWWPLSCIEIVRTEPDEIKVGDVVRATFWKAGQAAVVKEILADGRLMLDCSDQPWRVDEVVKLMRKVTT